MYSDEILRELRSLQVFLRKHEFGEYLFSNDFREWCFVRKLDARWREHLAIAERDRRVFGMWHTTEYHETAFWVWLSVRRSTPLQSDADLLLPVLSDFFRAGYSVDLEVLKSELKPLGYDQERVVQLWRDYKNYLSARQKRQANLGRNQPASVALQPKSKSNKVFVVHGHDESARLKLVALLKDHLGIEPIVVKDQPNASLEYLLSKIERLAGECSAAIILMTPDDELTSGSQPRPNVFIELGYFLGLWRSTEDRKIIVLKKDGTVEASDIRGVAHLRYGTEPKESYLELQQQFASWGIGAKSA